MTHAVQPRGGGGYAESSKSPALALIKAFILVVIGLGLAVLVLRNESSIVTRGPASADPALTAAWNTVRSPAATPDQLARAERVARSTLHREPLNSVAISLLGTLRERQGRAAEGETLMKAAVQMNHRENIADLWLFDHELSARHYDQAFLQADSLLRREQNFTQQLFPRLAQTLSDPAAIEPLGKRLAKAPAWRSIFVDELIQARANPAVMFQLFSAIKSAGGSVTNDELARLLSQLVEGGRFEEAYLDWIVLMPDALAAKLTYVYDGDFSGWPELGPFGWNFRSGVSGFIEPAPDRDDPALHIIYDGKSARNFPAQIMVLPPGQYVLTGEERSDTPAAAGEMMWSIQCVQAPTEDIARAISTDTSGHWARFSVPFTVSAGCKAQRLKLGAAPAPTRVDVDLWYDKLAVKPQGAGG